MLFLHTDVITIITELCLIQLHMLYINAVIDCVRSASSQLSWTPTRGALKEKAHSNRLHPQTMERLCSHSHPESYNTNPLFLD